MIKIPGDYKPVPGIGLLVTNSQQKNFLHIVCASCDKFHRSLEKTCSENRKLREHLRGKARGSFTSTYILNIEPKIHNVSKPDKATCRTYEARE